MKKIFDFIKKHKAGIALIISILAIACGQYFSKRADQEIKENKAFTSAIVTNIGTNGVSTTLFCKFKVNGVIYNCDGSASMRYGTSNEYIGKSFPIIYSSKNPHHNHLLVTPDDFERFDMGFPDSLNWVKKILNRPI